MVYKLVKIYCDSCPFNVTIIYTGKTEEEVKGWYYEVRQFIE